MHIEHVESRFLELLFERLWAVLASECRLRCAYGQEPKKSDWTLAYAYPLELRTERIRQRDEEVIALRVSHPGPTDRDGPPDSDTVPGVRVEIRDHGEILDMDRVGHSRLENKLQPLSIRGRHFSRSIGHVQKRSRC
jgi:hypothetical protein